MSEPTTSPAAVFGLPAFNGERHLAEALESLLVQTRADLAVVVVDDCSSDSTGEVAQRYARLDPRVAYVRNDRVLGLVRNWRRAFDLARERFPDARYFAWASDHDVWHPRWLELLAAELDGHPEAVLAYPLVVRVDDDGAEYPSREHRFDTVGSADAAERLHRTGRRMTGAGELVYGLARAAALARCSPFPLVVLPDRLQLLQLSVEGEFRQVPRRLLYRRHREGVTMSNSRQRRSAFPAGVPLRAFVPWWTAHPVLLARAVGGLRGAALGGRVLVDSVVHAAERSRARRRRERRWRARERRSRYRRLARAALVRAGLRESPTPPGAVGPVAAAAVGGPAPPVDEALGVLERAGVLDDLAEPGAAVLSLGGGSDELVRELASRLPGLVLLGRGEPGSDDRPAGARIVLAVSVGAFGGPPQQFEDVLAELAERGVPTLYSFDRESPGRRAELGRLYWLREAWAPRAATGAGDAVRRPDPLRGPAASGPGRLRHVVGRRRLLPEG